MLSTKNLLKLNRFITNNRIKFFLVYLADLLRLRYTILRFDPSSTCNLRCKMCYSSDPDWKKQNPPINFNDQEILMIAKHFFPTALQLYIGCGMEPTTYKNFTNIINIAKNYYKVPFVSLITNGQLLTKTHLYQFVEYKLDELTLSTHGVDVKTYEDLMPGASFQKLIELLTAIDYTKKSLNSNKPSLRINYTVNPDNLAELRDFFKVYGKVNIDTIQLRPIINFGVNNEYKNYDLLSVIDEYNEVISQLKKLCKDRGIVLIYNEIDPTYADVNKFAPVYLEGVVRFINPRMVWREEFDWKNESYNEFKRRIGFRRKMLEYALNKRKIDYQKTPFAISQVL